MSHHRLSRRRPRLRRCRFRVVVDFSWSSLINRRSPSSSCPLVFVVVFVLVLAVAVSVAVVVAVVATAVVVVFAAIDALIAALSVSMWAHGPFVKTWWGNTNLPHQFD